jgi:O-antigen/teichoic acid export membrane protein
MRRGDRIGFFGNSMANLAVGGAGLGYAVIVPAIVVREFGTDVYGVWYLAFQVAAYVLLLDLGSQWLVTNAAATSAPDGGAARLTTAAMVTQAALASLMVGVATAWALLADQTTLARLLPILGIAAAASLLASTVRAWFGGLQRAHVPAAWLIGARVAALAGLAAALGAGTGLVGMTAALALPQLALHTGLLLRARRPPSPWARPAAEDFARLVRTCLPLALWTVCGVMIAGVDIFVVRAVDPSKVGEYGIALPLLALPIGVVTAAMSAWTPRVAATEASAPQGGREPTLTATTLMVAALAAGAIPFVAFAREVVGLWAGGGRGGSAPTYLQLLYVAAALRFAFMPWSVLVVVRGEQGLVTRAPLVEAVVNLSASVVLGVWLGAAGVALGTIVGVVVAAALYVAWAVPRTSGTGVTSAGLLRAAAAARVPVGGTVALALVASAGAPAPVQWATAGIVLGVDAAWLLRRSALGRPADRGQAHAPA